MQMVLEIKKYLHPNLKGEGLLSEEFALVIKTHISILIGQLDNLFSSEEPNLFVNHTKEESQYITFPLSMLRMFQS